MTISTACASNVALRVTVKAVAFVLSSFVALFAASAGYGLLKVLLVAVANGTDVEAAELSTHSGLTFAFFVFAGLSAYVAKKCFW